ncbi:hypothetical protein [Micromonospora sp. LOL_023]|uniref:hypothetical protein n=1 Tax=Micromonospora sp. LOL_023 TaxID=3345418 RepID=UPI003A84CA27
MPERSEQDAKEAGFTVPDLAVPEFTLPDVELPAAAPRPVRSAPSTGPQSGGSRRGRAGGRDQRVGGGRNYQFRRS